MTSMGQYIELGSAWTQPFHVLSFVQRWTSASGDQVRISEANMQATRSLASLVCQIMFMP